MSHFVPLLGGTPVQIKAGFQVEVGINDLQGSWIYKKTVNEQEA